MQSLRINVFFGSSEDVAKLQIWIVGAVYLFIAIVEKRLRLSPSLNEFFQILSLTMLEKTPIDQLAQGLGPLL
jgi:hypothetical protein